MPKGKRDDRFFDEMYESQFKEEDELVESDDDDDPWKNWGEEV